jgi:predicted nucleic acid-binding protein
VAAFPVFLDACVLVPIRLTDMLLRLASAGTYRPLWSADVLAEVERNLVGKFALPADKVAKRITNMRRAFPDAMVTGYEGLIDAMTNDVKDRHVLAAAVAGHASIIVTENLKDFPPAALQPHGIDAISADEFLLDLLDLHPRQTAECVRKLVLSMKNPPFALEEFLAGFVKTAPRFVEAARPVLR